MRHQWSGAPQPLPMATTAFNQQPMPAAEPPQSMQMENLMDQKRTDALLSWYASGRGRNAEGDNKVSNMARKLRRASKLKERAKQFQQMTGGAPSLESLRGLLAKRMESMS